ncbi:hypothetical protein R69746_07378 [Paraburkholderia aspalathi]|uniref:hypothetical protein n=1 Tax=Paraburkholderia aspalathi TaxID=1324617 RepID=UPI00190D91DD|nr:hypothetical protein [Paraburkholderia aspalathi]MBK3843343.1 hypothetical protein [Paraburkholderia aspalathi]CAE6851558.1 hypothetical protein R69746_07378 [Paraburkholderia aspalathi]
MESGRYAGELGSQLTDMRRAAATYFDELEAAIPVKEDNWISSFDARNRDLYWGQLTDEQRGNARQLAQRMLDLAGQLAEAARNSPLASEADVRDVMIGAKTLRAALLLRKFYHTPIEVLHDEGMVLGVQPASQSEEEPASPSAASRAFDEWIGKLVGIEELIAASRSLTAGAGVQSSASAKYRPGTAFIIMAMSKGKPELDDVVDAVKEVFGQFGVEAVRADDIEHEGLITERIIKEIETAEFLFADLSLERPNVYYEVDYAHAMKRRVILFRSKGTGMHFDLAGYNCPEYSNIRELRQLLSQRLRHVTNRDPKGGD